MSKTVRGVARAARHVPLVLAVVLALTAGAASTAVAANGGNFILGSLGNAATAITRLTGDVAGPSLQIVNPNTGAGARALDLRVAAGKQPLTVNATAGKATNLNADKVDGQNAPLLMRVGADGDLASNDTVASVAHTPGSGYYEFRFVNNRAVAGCVYQATLVNTPGGGEISVHPGSQLNRLTVITTRNGLVFSDRYDMSFHLVIYC